MRVRNLIYVVDFEEVMQQVRDFCTMINQVLDEFSEGESKRFLRDTIKAMYAHLKGNGAENTNLSMSESSEESK